MISKPPSKLTLASVESSHKLRKRHKSKKKVSKDPDSLDYIIRRLRKYFNQQKTRGNSRSHKDLSLDALICLEKMIFNSIR